MVKSYNIHDNRKSLSYVFAVLLVMLAVSSIVILTPDIATSKKSRHLGGNFTTDGDHHSNGSRDKGKGRGLIQIASLSTDFPNNDPNALQFHVTKATKNILGYEIDGEVINVSNKTFYTRPIVVRMFDKDNGPIGSPTGDIGTTQLAPNHSGTFKILINPNDLLGKPTSYRLTFTGTFQ